MTQLDLSVAPTDEAPATSRRGWFLLPLGIFLATRVVDVILLLLGLRSQIPASQIPTEGVVVPTVLEPKNYTNVIQSWDGQWFRLIAEHGYPHALPVVDGSVIQNQWGFYPLFPSLVRGIMATTHLPFGASAALLNTTLAAVGMCVLFRMVADTASRFSGAMSVVAASTFPSAVVFQTAYSESLTFLLVVGSVRLLTKRRYGWVMVLGLLLSLTRPVVLPLALVVLIHGLVRWRARDRESFPTRDRVQVLTLAGGLAASFAIWPVTAWIVTGTRNAYLVSLGAWNSGHEVGGGESWVTQALSGHWFVLFIVVLAVGGQWFFLLRSQARLWAPELRVWSFSYAAYLLVATRPQGSFVRHLLMAVVPWWPFPEIGERVTSRRQQVALGVAVACLGFVAQFFWIHWFWIPSRAEISFP